MLRELPEGSRAVRGVRSWDRHALARPARHGNGPGRRRAHRRLLVGHEAVQDSAAASERRARGEELTASCAVPGAADRRARRTDAFNPELGKFIMPSAGAAWPPPRGGNGRDG